MAFLDKVDSVGWIFFALTSVLFSLPGGYLGWQYTNDTMTPVGRIVSGVVMAVIAAAFFTFVVNEILYRLHLRRESNQEQTKSTSPKGKPGKGAK